MYHLLNETYKYFTSNCQINMNKYMLSIIKHIFIKG